MNQEIESVDRIKKYYEIIENELLPDSYLSERVGIVRWLEKATHQEFKNTEDFRNKMQRFLTSGDKLKKARKKKGWSQEVTSYYLGVSKQFISKMEKGTKPLNQKALQFIDKIYENFD